MNGTDFLTILGTSGLISGTIEIVKRIIEARKEKGDQNVRLADISERRHEKEIDGVSNLSLEIVKSWSEERKEVVGRLNSLIDTCKDQETRLQRSEVAEKAALKELDRVIGERNHFAALAKKYKINLETTVQQLSETKQKVAEILKMISEASDEIKRLELLLRSHGIDPKASPKTTA